MTAHVVTSACEHPRRVVSAPLCDACELAPIEAAPAPARTDCAEGPTWRAHVHADDWRDAHTAAREALDATTEGA